MGSRYIPVIDIEPRDGVPILDRSKVGAHHSTCKHAGVTAYLCILRGAFTTDSLRSHADLQGCMSQVLGELILLPAPLWRGPTCLESRVAAPRHGEKLGNGAKRARWVLGY